MKCENCGDPITLKRYLSVSITAQALCDICKNLSKAKRRARMALAIKPK